ncbi:pyridoxamine 5'-phosphate oxidase family protein [Cetobacterium sp. 2A]|uniref:pyridoxamine 5'-phosphate oxidase family protein n=1 Tax=Cetobacterium sp. 2A TaxID=2754723 RepID=UPI00163CD43C|nr:pyridoxamine 5'-phosphate oxidase family protein [Cetobacterium sp. 2A]MBC2854901.1 pyridoxamine 5'-phosphate oxidase family protein [Cetobacterium sp. 2A]
MKNNDLYGNINSGEILSEMEEFIDKFKSVIIGTVSIDGGVDLTYAPYLKLDGENYIYISEIGDHFSNLKNKEQIFEIMFLEDESECVSPVVRKRVRFNVNAEFLPRDEEFEKVLDSFEEKVGKHMKITRNMKDFHLVKLNILNGRFVKGFGKAYKIQNDGEGFKWKK